MNLKVYIRMKRYRFLALIVFSAFLVPVYAQTQDSYDYQSEFTWGINKNNVPEEKDMLTNLKLWWARLFKKSETQPDHLKEKGGKPRYDKGEAGLWYE